MKVKRQTIKNDKGNNLLRGMQHKKYKFGH
jgi:hypothetical protein